MTYIINPYAFAAPDNNIYASTAAWRGNGSTQSITDVGFQPDFVMSFDNPNATLSPFITDSTRGVGKQLSPSSTPIAESSNANFITGFTAGGFDLGAGSGMNSNFLAYTALCLKKNTGFFDIVTYTGNATNRVINHSLNGAPDMMIIVNITDSGSADWPVYHASNGATNYQLFNRQAASAASSAYWNNTAPSATQFTVGTDNSVNGSGDSMIAYLFKNNTNFCSIGTYTGDGTNPGPTITTGFQPYYIIIKHASTTGNWYVVNRGLNITNTPSAAYTFSSAVPAPTGAQGISFDATSFQLKTSSSVLNAAGTVYIYMAFNAASPHGFFVANGTSTESGTLIVPPSVSLIKEQLLISNSRASGGASSAANGGGGSGSGAVATNTNISVSPGDSFSFSKFDAGSASSSTLGSMTCTPGAVGQSGSGGGAGGAGGTASGGTTNTNGNAGTAHSGTTGGNGGDTPGHPGSGALGAPGANAAGNTGTFYGAGSSGGNSTSGAGKIGKQGYISQLW